MNISNSLFYPTLNYEIIINCTGISRQGRSISYDIERPGRLMPV